MDDVYACFGWSDTCDATVINYIASYYNKLMYYYLKSNKDESITVKLKASHQWHSQTQQVAGHNLAYWLLY